MDAQWERITRESVLKEAETIAKALDDYLNEDPGTYKANLPDGADNYINDIVDQLESGKASDVRKYLFDDVEEWECDTGDYFSNMSEKAKTLIVDLILYEMDWVGLGASEALLVAQNSLDMDVKNPGELWIYEEEKNALPESIIRSMQLTYIKLVYPLAREKENSDRYSFYLREMKKRFGSNIVTESAEELAKRIDMISRNWFEGWREATKGQRVLPAYEYLAKRQSARQGLASEWSETLKEGWVEKLLDEVKHTDFEKERGVDRGMDL